jgi:hypothetical protein
MPRGSVGSLVPLTVALGLTALLVSAAAATAVAQTREERAASADETAAARD